MRKVQVYKRDVEALAWAVAALDDTPATSIAGRHVTSLRALLERATTRAPVKDTTRLSLADAEDVLLGRAPGKYAKWRGGDPVKALQVWYRHDPTLDQVRAVAEWLRVQGWIHNPVSFQQLVTKWPDWLARAMAEPAPAQHATPAGFEEES